MFVSLLEVIIVGMVTGAACMYTFQKQKRVTILFILLFVCSFYLGFLLSSQWVRVTEALWVFDVFRLVLALALFVLGLLSFVPYHGFFHVHGKYIWLAVSMLFWYTGWHTGHWLSSILGIAVLVLLFITAFVVGNTVQSIIHFKMKGKTFVPFLPFAVLLFFSFLMLL
ncbi:hypothetical protein [Salibacterium aidingense]|uniref:hypothetical protein n=1 Tax=Salibacterium aidingense TaxID=384933 RepID=UPI000406227A|nr:hypothetical protein [Salibacterium aidingense]